MKFLRGKITGQFVGGHEGIVKFCGCYSGHRKASPPAPVLPQTHHVGVHHICKTVRNRINKQRMPQSKAA